MIIKNFSYSKFMLRRLAMLKTPVLSKSAWSIAKAFSWSMQIWKYYSSYLLNKEFKSKSIKTLQFSEIFDLEDICVTIVKYCTSLWFAPNWVLNSLHYHNHAWICSQRGVACLVQVHQKFDAFLTCSYNFVQLFQAHQRIG